MRATATVDRRGRSFRLGLYYDLEAARQRPEQLEHGDVERDARHCQPCSSLCGAKHRLMPAQKLTTLRCEIITPFGSPVEPEV